jgi:hypothetical protein
LESQVKIRRLSEIDLARFVALPAGDVLERALVAYERGGGSWSYDPVRNSTGDILAARMPLLTTAAPSWAQIQTQIARASVRGPIQAKANIEVGKALHDAASRHNWRAAVMQFGRMPLGFGESVAYWSNVVIEENGELIIPFFDHRREHGISNGEVRRVVFSMQNVWARDRVPDLQDAKLAVVSFPSAKEGRTFSMRIHAEADLYSYDELNQRVQAVYQTWAKVVHEAGERRRKGGGENPMGF